ncbi:MAG TPA: cytochrome c [Anaerolineales bacterium]|nr:cytochrome c [Anaerolineales bacterium]
MNPRLQRGLLIIGLVLTPFIVGLLFTFEVIKIPFPTDMANQVSVGYQEGPRLLPPDGAVPVQGLAVIPEEVPSNPIPADATSLQRGAVLYGIHCQLCHGEQGHGDGPLADRFDRTPQNLTSSTIGSEFDGAVYLTITQGFGQMPALAENLTPRERWDVVNYVRTLPAQ